MHFLARKATSRGKGVAWWGRRERGRPYEEWGPVWKETVAEWADLAPLEGHQYLGIQQMYRSMYKYMCMMQYHLYCMYTSSLHVYLTCVCVCVCVCLCAHAAGCCVFTNCLCIWVSVTCSSSCSSQSYLPHNRHSPGALCGLLLPSSTPPCATAVASLPSSLRSNWVEGEGSCCVHGAGWGGLEGDPLDCTESVMHKKERIKHSNTYRELVHVLTLNMSYTCIITGWQEGETEATACVWSPLSPLTHPCDHHTQAHLYPTPSRHLDYIL